MKTAQQKVIVLLAVYNGHTYLEEQLASIISQEDVHTVIYANDDGSDDGSFELLKTWQENGLISKVTQSNRIGASQAFLKLLNEVDSPDYVAFCDQDDIWNRNKLYLQIDHLIATKSLLSFCPRIYINSDGFVIGRSRKLRVEPSFRNALVENIAPGNTILLHPTAVNLIRKTSVFKVDHYDSWIYLLISGKGSCAYLPIPLVSYRVHNSNLVGIRKFRFRNILNSVEKYVDNACTLEKYAYDQLSYENQLALKSFNRNMESDSIFKFIYGLSKPKFRRHSNFDQIGVVFLMILYYGKRRLISIDNRR